MLKCKGSGGEVLGGVLSGFPVVGEQVVEAANGMDADAVENVTEVGERIHAEPFPCANEACADRR